MAEMEDVIRAAARILADAALDLLQADQHSWSERPCSTCLAIGTLMGRNFGCYLYAAQRRLQREKEDRRG